MTAALKKVPAIYVPRSAQQAADLMVAVAGSQIGYHEGRSSSGEWNNDTMFGVWYGMNYAAWCAMFISWCSAVCGFTKIIPKHAYTPDGFNWFASRGLADGRRPPSKKGVAATGRGKPRVGDIMYVYSVSNGRISHVGLVEKVNSDGTVSSIEGNTNTSGSAQGDGVYRLRRPITSRLYFCHPQYAAVIGKTTPSKPPAAKPDTIPPNEQDWVDMATKQELTEAFADALKAALPAQTAADRQVTATYVTADNRYEAQAQGYFVAAEAFAEVRMAELLKAGTEPREAMEQVRQEVSPFLSPLWATPAKKV